MDMHALSSLFFRWKAFNLFSIIREKYYVKAHTRLFLKEPERERERNWISCSIHHKKINNQLNVRAVLLTTFTCLVSCVNPLHLILKLNSRCVTCTQRRGWVYVCGCGCFLKLRQYIRMENVLNLYGSRGVKKKFFFRI
jgi:hypothetical protein